MTTVVIFKSHDTYKGFTCRGHAGYGVSGSDIVCASISILVINTINAVEELAKEKITVESNEKEGYIECHFPEKINDKAKLLMDCMVMGLKGIEKNYGGENYFKLIIKNGGVKS